jgi:tripeptide aminopeptidase
MDLLRVPGTSGDEGKVAQAVRAKLRAAGCRPSWIVEDRAHHRIGRGFTCGNLICRLPGTTSGPRLMFSGHMDTVPLCRGAQPVRRGGRIVARGATALGADNRTAVACLVTLVEGLLRERPSHPPLTLIFTVGEEVGLLGARYATKKDLGRPCMGFNFDSGAPEKVIVGAIGADRWQAHIRGRSAHAGVHPEDGVSAVLIAARAIRDIERKGFFGAIRKRAGRGTSNTGSVHGGEVTNQVTDEMLLHGECRSHDPAFLDEITRVHREAFARAAGEVRNAAGQCGKVRFEVDRAYHAFVLDPDAEAVTRAEAALRALGRIPERVVVDGGLDANFFHARGVPTVTLGAGQHGAHTVGEYVDLEEFLGGCELACSIATGAGRPA